MLGIIDSIQKTGSCSPQGQDISPLLLAINSANFDEFVKLMDSFDLSQVYDHDEFPEPQLLSQFLLFRFLGFISVEGENHFPNGFPRAADFIRAVLEKNPDLTFQIEDDYSFPDFIKDRRQVLTEAIAGLRSHPETYIGKIPLDLLIQSYEVELSQIELISSYL